MQTDGIREDLARLVAASSGSGGVDRVALVPGVVPGSRADAPEPASDAPSQASSSLTREITELARQVAGLRETSARQVESLDANTRAASSGSGSQTVFQRVADVASTARGPLNFGLSPLITGLARLFGAGKSEPPPALPAFELPQAVDVDAGFSAARGGFGEVSRGTDSLPRLSRPAETPLVSINVNAMDSRSFLDHSSEIARAVRQAMLDTHSLNDVVSDL